VTFGPSEMAQLMLEAQALFVVVMLWSVGTGIVLGSIIACYKIIRAKRQGTRFDPLIFPVKADKGESPLETWLRLELEPLVQQLGRSRDSGPASSRSGGRQSLRTAFASRRLRLFAVTILLAVGGGALYWYHTSKGEAECREYATGTARIPFPGTSVFRMLTVVVNGVAGNFILDTGAESVSITPQFARKAKVATENPVTMEGPGGGHFLADIGYANSVSVGKAGASGVATVVLRDDDPFGKELDGLLGMSFLSRFEIKLSRTAIELTAICG
jgi:hypothetical protein